MPNRTRRNSRSGKIQPRIISKTRASLQNLPVGKQELLSLRQAIYQLRVPLEAALTKGYSYSELANLLQQQGISISGATLRSYLTSGRRQEPRITALNESRDTGSSKILETPSSDVEVFIPSKTETFSYTVGRDFWSAYQESLREREEVYRRLAES